MEADGMAVWGRRMATKRHEETRKGGGRGRGICGGNASGGPCGGDEELAFEGFCAVSCLFVAGRRREGRNRHEEAQMDTKYGKAGGGEGRKRMIRRKSRNSMRCGGEAGVAGGAPELVSS
jgi:hypothetical protein